MKDKIKLAVIATLMVCGSAHAGLFGDSAPPDKFMNLEVGVLRHYGSTSGYGFTLRQYIEAMKPAGGKQEWKKDSEKKWTHVITINDNATGTKQRMAIVFQEDGKYASIVRYVENDKEVKQYYLGSAVDTFLIPIAQKLNSGKEPTSAVTKQANNKDGKTEKASPAKRSIAGTYECNGEGETVKIESTAKDQIKLSYANACGDKRLSFNDLTGKLKCSGDICKAKFTSGKCSLFLEASNDSPNQVNVFSEDHEADESYDCCNDKHTIVSGECRRPASTSN